jgi:hypothetical protein
MASSPWKGFFSLSVALLVLLLFSVPYIEPGSSTAVIAKLTAGILILNIVTAAILIRIDWRPLTP